MGRLIDREKVIKGLEQFRTDFKPYVGNGADWKRFDDAVALLKEHDEQIKNRDESLEKAREEIKWLRGMLKEQEAVVLCKDCERRGTYDCPVYVGGDGMYSEPDDWFCADGERGG